MTISSRTYEEAPFKAQTGSADFLQNPALSRLLSRLAALLGQAVPAFRFGMLERSANGVELNQLPLHHQAREMWTARFPGAQIWDVDVSRILCRPRIEVQ